MATTRDGCTRVTRLPIKRSAWWAPLLWLFGATRNQSYIQIEQDVVAVRFGWYRLVIPREQIVSAEAAHWPILGGIGWRTNFRGTIGLIGAYAPVIHLRIAPAERVRLLRIPVRLTDLYISVDQPDAVRAALMES
jgi:hypothetical protein